MIAPGRQKLTKKALLDMEVDLQFSPDSNYLALIVKKQYQAGGPGFIAVFDKLLMRKSFFTASFPKTSSGTKQQIAVNNLAEVFILTTKAPEKRKNTGILTLQRSAGDAMGRPVVLKSTTPHLSNARMIVNQDQKPSLIAFYQDKPNTRSGFDGILSCLPDEDGNLQITHQRPFVMEEVTKTYSAREEKKAKRKNRRGEDVDESAQFEFLDFLPTADGGAIAVAEEQYLEIVHRTSSTNRAMADRVTYVYHYGDLLVARVNSKFELEWTKKIAKHDRFANHASLKLFDKYYSCFIKGNTAFFVFSGPQGLEENKHSQSMVLNGRNNSTYLATLSPEGVLNRKELIKGRDVNNFAVDATRSVRVEGDKLYFVAKPTGIGPGLFSKRSRVCSVKLPAAGGAGQ
jgi:hypothetical protein